MPSTAELKTLTRLKVSTKQGATIFLREIAKYPDIHSKIDIAARIRQAEKTMRLTGDELRLGNRTMQDDVACINGPITFDVAREAHPEHNPASLRVCLSRLMNEGVLEKLGPGVYWNRKGDRPTPDQVARVKQGPPPVERVAHLSGSAVIMKLEAALPPAMFKRIVEVL